MQETSSENCTLICQPLQSLPEFEVDNKKKYAQLILNFFWVVYIMGARQSIYIFCVKDHGCKTIRLYILCQRSWVQDNPFIYSVSKIMGARASVYIFCVKRSWVQDNPFIYSVSKIMGARQSVYIFCVKDHGCKTIRLYILCQRSWVQDNPFIYSVSKIMGARQSVYIFCVKDHGCKTIRLYILCQRSWVQEHLMGIPIGTVGNPGIQNNPNWNQVPSPDCMQHLSYSSMKIRQPLWLSVFTLGQTDGHKTRIILLALDTPIL